MLSRSCNAGGGAPALLPSTSPRHVLSLAQAAVLCFHCQAKASVALCFHLNGHVSRYAVQKWWLIIPLLAAAGFAGYAWYKHTKNAGGDGSSAAEEELKTDTYPTNVTGAYPKQENPDRPASSASASNTDVSGQTPRSKDPSAESGPSTRSCRHDDYLDPRHVRHVDISQSFLSAANAFQTEE